MGGEPVPRQQGKNDRSIPCLSNEIGPCRPYGFQGSYCVGGTSRDTNSKKSRMPSGRKKLRKCSSNCARVDALSLGWQDVLKQRKRPLLGRPPCVCLPFPCSPLMRLIINWEMVKWVKSEDWPDTEAIRLTAVAPIIAEEVPTVDAFLLRS